jgi:hypothetical protein
MPEKDFGRISIAIGWLISIRDSDIKDRSLTFGPKAMYCEVAAKFWGRFSALGAGYYHVSTGIDERFV